MIYDRDSLAQIITDSLLGLEYKHKIRLLSLVKRPADILELPPAADEYLSASLGNKAGTIRLALKDGDYHAYVLDSLEKRGTVCVPLESENYPFALKQTPLPPLVLYCNGDAGLLNDKNIFGIVGSRKCLPDYNAHAENFSKELTKAGAVIVTGSAGGADAAAIKGALSSGKIISVIAGGIDHVYPEYNRSLIEKVAAKGLVVSEQPPDYPVKPWMFPMRNRIIAGLSRGVLIVGGEKDSGARHTAYAAVEYGREVFAFPYSLGIKTGELNNELIRSGAFLCTEIKDITDFLELKTVEDVSYSLSGDKATVYELIKSGVNETFAIVEKTEIPVYELAAVLSELEIDGLIVKLSGNKYKTIK